jgi:hypothetical protein
VEEETTGKSTGPLSSVTSGVKKVTEKIKGVQWPRRIFSSDLIVLYTESEKKEAWLKPEGELWTVVFAGFKSKGDVASDVLGNKIADKFSALWTDLKASV